MTAEPRVRVGAAAQASSSSPTSHPPAWTATGGGIVVLLAVSLSVPVLAVPLGLGVVVLSVIVLARATDRGGTGAGHGLAGLVSASVGLVIAVTLALAYPTMTGELGLGVAGAPPLSGDVSAPSAPQQPPVWLQPVGVEASGSAAAGQDSSGILVTFDPVNILDGDPATTWRIDGDGVGETLTFTFDRWVHLTAVGMIPGYAKVDPASGVDRFAQNRRVISARFVFTDGSSVDVTFADAPTMQTVHVDVDTTSVQVWILSSSPRAERDFTAISEVKFDGWETG